MNIAVILFPGTNNERETLRALRRNGMEAFLFRWNDDVKLLEDADGYFLAGGFSYEDRGRAGLVAGRDPLIGTLKEQAQEGKVIIGHCNGAQILVESGLVPFGKHLTMCLAPNRPRGFRNEWVQITPACARGRCATSDWTGAIRVPIAHGEGRFITNDPDVLKELQKNDQIAFRYCDTKGVVSEEFPVTPNGSMAAIAGICNEEGNIVALMPHPERTENGDRYFVSLKRWMEKKVRGGSPPLRERASYPSLLFSPSGREGSAELFIDTIITNNEERTLESLLRRFIPEATIRQFRYKKLKEKESPAEILSHISFFNPNKEIAYIRRKERVFLWSPQKQQEISTEKHPFRGEILLLCTGDNEAVCYVCQGIKQDSLAPAIQHIFANPHTDRLQVLTKEKKSA